MRITYTCCPWCKTHCSRFASLLSMLFPPHGLALCALPPHTLHWPSQSGFDRDCSNLAPLSQCPAWFEIWSQAELACLPPPGTEFKTGQYAGTTVVNWDSPIKPGHLMTLPCTSVPSHPRTPGPWLSRSLTHSAASLSLR